VDSIDRSTVKLVVDGVAARIAEVIGALAILLWLQQTAPGGVLAMPLNTGWISWVILATVVIWLIVTQKLRGQMIDGKPDHRPGAFEEIECERFPDQCPCTTELGKGVA
jgi:hypothetical protein